VFLARFSARVPLIAALAIVLRFAVLAAFTALSPVTILADVLWAVTLVQVLARVVDLGLPSLMRIVLLRRVGRRTAESPVMWFIYFTYCAGACAVLTLPVYLLSDSRADVPIVLMTLHGACLALNNMVLARQLAQDRPAIAWNQLVPHVLPLLVVGVEALWSRQLFEDTTHVYAFYAAGDFLLAGVSLWAAYRLRGLRTAPIRRLFKTLKTSGTPRFLALSWCSQLVKLFNQKTERLLAIGFLSAEAYVVTSYILAMRDGISGVAGMAMYKQFNQVLRRHWRRATDPIASRLFVPTLLMLVTSVLTAVALWWMLPSVLRFLPAYRFDSDALSIALMLAGIVPFIYIQIIGQISVAERSQNFNFFCQAASLVCMLLAQLTGAYLGAIPLAWVGPFLASVVILFKVAALSKTQPGSTAPLAGTVREPESVGEPDRRRPITPVHTGVMRSARPGK
jgi:hypothetical protein